MAIQYQVKRGQTWVTLDEEDVRWEVKDEAAASREAEGTVDVGGQTYRWSRPEAIGRRIGRAMARDARAEGAPHEWTGLDAQDGDQATAAGIEPDSEAWEQMEAAARQEFERAMAEGNR